MKPTKTVKPTKIAKITKSEYHDHVVPALAVYRNEMHEMLGIKKDIPYIRLFTEKRMRGIRSKYWGKYRAFPIHDMAVYVSSNPTFTANNEVYEVTFKDECSWDGQPSAGLYANKIWTSKSK